MIEPIVNVTTVGMHIAGSWNSMTSADSANWSRDNPAWGQCAITALIAQDFLGGEILRIDLSTHKDPKISAMRSHYFNRINGNEVDFTRWQFSADYNEFNLVLASQTPEIRTREYLLGNQSTRDRYLLLRFSVAKSLGNFHPLFNSKTYRECLTLALQSNCQKAKYGCVVLYGGEGREVAKTFNHVLEPLRDWCSPECIRMKIQSRTESMIGCCGHAEELALVAIRDAGIDPNDCDLFVAGFYPNGLAHIKQEAVHTCLRCATQMYLHRIGHVFVPTIDGWKGISAEEALNTAKSFALKEKLI